MATQRFCVLSPPKIVFFWSNLTNRWVGSTTNESSQKIPDLIWFEPTLRSLNKNKYCLKRYAFCVSMSFFLVCLSIGGGNSNIFENRTKIGEMILHLTSIFFTDGLVQPATTVVIFWWQNRNHTRQKATRQLFKAPKNHRTRYKVGPYQL